MTETRGRKNNLYLLIMLPFVIGCSSPKRDFFQNMHENFDDIKVDSSFYFIKSFTFSQNPTSIGGIEYWRLRSSEESLFSLSGYLRKLNDSIMLIPENGKQNMVERKLFDFRSNKGSHWKVVRGFRGASSFVGDSVVFSDVKVSKGDTIYSYAMHSFMYNGYEKRTRSTGRVFILEISRRNGIISISKLRADGRALSFKATLFPVQSFTITEPRELDL